MKRFLASVLAVLTVLSCVAVVSVSADAPAYKTPEFGVLAYELDENQKDTIYGVYYTINTDTMTAVVGKDTYSDSASAGEFDDMVIIPDFVEFEGIQYPVVRVGRNAFDGTGIKFIEISATVKEIGEFAFAGCESLTVVVMRGVRTIAGFAFWGCPVLTSVSFGNELQTVGGGAFWNDANLGCVVLPASCTKVMTKAFEGIGVPSVYVLGAAPASADDILFIAIDGTEQPYFGTYYFPAGEETAVYMAVTFFKPDQGFFYEPGTYSGFDYTDEIYPEFSNVAFNESEYYGNEIWGFGAAYVYKVNSTAEAVSMTDDGVIVCEHTETETVTRKAASCLDAGTADTVCAACRKVLSTAEVEAAGHTYTDFVISATCENAGYTRHICDVCGDRYTSDEVPATGHVWDDGEVIVQASTSKAGQTEYTCQTCGKTEKVELPKVTYGDVNMDGKINVSDVTALLKALAKWDMTETIRNTVYDIGGTTYNVVNADANGDGKVTVSDATTLLKYIANWGITLGPKA